MCYYNANDSRLQLSRLKPEYLLYGSLEFWFKSRSTKP